MEYLPLSLSTIQRATQVYLAVSYGWAAYKCIDSYYSNARTVIQVCHNGYRLSAHAKHKLVTWWKTPNAEQDKSVGIQLTDIVPHQANTRIHIPTSLDDAVVTWFVEEINEKETPGREKEGRAKVTPESSGCSVFRPVS